MVPVRFPAPDVMNFQVAANKRRINGQRKLGLVTVNFSFFVIRVGDIKCNGKINWLLCFLALQTRDDASQKRLICAIYKDSLPRFIIIPIILLFALVLLLNHIQQRSHPHQSGTNAAPPSADPRTCSSGRSNRARQKLSFCSWFSPLLLIIIIIILSSSSSFGLWGRRTSQQSFMCMTFPCIRVKVA